MKKLLITAAALIFVITGIAFAKDYEVRQKADNLDVEVRMDKNPPSLGDNNMEIRLKDSAGKAVTNAKVKVEYSMPAMPGMPPMNYKTNTALKGDTYSAIIDFSMKGPWDVIVKITSDGKTSKVKFNVDVN